jgi:hypothetical protein
MGGTVRVRLHTVYATPRKPSGEPWDGLSGRNQELACNVAADVVRRGVSAELASMALPAATFDRVVGGTFERVVRNLCGLGANWLQMQFEGPDMFATSSDWGQTRAVQDRWIADVNLTNTNAPTEWTYRCGTRQSLVRFDVVDEDIAFDDPVEQVTVNVASAPPAALCDGWAWKDGQSGLVGTLLRLQVDGSGQNCDGLRSEALRDHVLYPVERLSLPSSGTASRAPVDHNVRPRF